MTGDSPGMPGVPPRNEVGTPGVSPGNRAPRSYVILGTGAMGIYYGGLLHNARFRVTFLSTRPGTRADRFVVESASREIIISNPRIVSRAEDAGPHDAAIITLKTTQNHLLPETLPRVLNAGGTAIFLQNGIGVEEEALRVVAPEQIFIGLCYIGVEKIAPERVRHVDGGRIVLGALVGRVSDPPIRSLPIASDFTTAGIPVQPTGDILRAQWQKLLWNIPFNGLSVVLDLMPHEIAGSLPSSSGRGAGGEGEQQGGLVPESPSPCPRPRGEGSDISRDEVNRQSSIVNHQSPLALVEAIMREVLAAARATGHPLPDSLVPQLINYTRTLPPFHTSMRMDFDRGRELELKTMYENPIALARTHGITMPATEWLWRELRERSPHP